MALTAFAFERDIAFSGPAILADRDFLPIYFEPEFAVVSGDAVMVPLRRTLAALFGWEAATSPLSGSACGGHGRSPDGEEVTVGGEPLVFAFDVVTVVEDLHFNAACVTCSNGWDSVAPNEDAAISARLHVAPIDFHHEVFVDLFGSHVTGRIAVGDNHAVANGERFWCHIDGNPAGEVFPIEHGLETFRWSFGGKEGGCDEAQDGCEGAHGGFHPEAMPHFARASERLVRVLVRASAMRESCEDGLEGHLAFACVGVSCGGPCFGFDGFTGFCCWDFEAEFFGNKNGGPADGGLRFWVHVHGGADAVCEVLHGGCGLLNPTGDEVFRRTSSNRFSEESGDCTNTVVG